MLKMDLSNVEFLIVFTLKSSMSFHMAYIFLILGPMCVSQVKIVAVTSTELRAICEKGLLLLTITIPEMEVLFYHIIIASSCSCFLL